MEKIITRTSITQIRADMKIRPQGVTWTIVNDGVATMMLNNFPIATGERFGIDSSQLVPVPWADDVDNRRFNYENESEFDITFPINNTYPVGSPAYALQNFKSAKLIETIYVKVITQ